MGRGLSERCKRQRGARRLSPLGRQTGGRALWAEALPPRKHLALKMVLGVAADQIGAVNLTRVWRCRPLQSPQLYVSLPGSFLTHRKVNIV